MMDCKRDPFGGPFNGQAGRVAIFDDLLRVFAFQAIVETGAFTGTTTEFFAMRALAPVFAVEVSPWHESYVRQRLAGVGHVRLTLGDSRVFLDHLSTDRRFPHFSVFFYLDAHWGQSLPLWQEVAIVLEHWRRSAVMIDDFQVPDDAGYEFDDYGPDRRLCLAGICSLLRKEIGVFFPTLRSEQETGFRRGCVVLGTDQDASELLMSVRTLRRWWRPDEC